MDLSIVIVSRNTCALLHECLQSIDDAIGKSVSYEVVVVDNASTDGSSEMVRAQFPRTRLIGNSFNAGFARANNQGVSVSSGHFLLFLNPDTIIYPGSTEHMLHFMTETAMAGAATCRVELPDGSLDDACHRGFPTPWNALCHFSGLAHLFPRSRVFAGYSLGWEDKLRTHEIGALAGAYMLVRREAGEDVNWWDEDYFFYGDDLDFCYRLKAAGWSTYFVPHTAIMHHKGASSGIRGESRSVTTADTETRLQSTTARFDAMRTFYQKHYAYRSRALRTAVLVGIGLKERYALWAAGAPARRRGSTRRALPPLPGQPED